MSAAKHIRQEAPAQAVSRAAWQGQAAQAPKPVRQPETQILTAQAVPTAGRSAQVSAWDHDSLNRETALIAEWLGQVRFKPKAFGGVDEADVWRKLDELNSLYERALLAERARCDALISERGRASSAQAFARESHMPRDSAIAGRRA